MEFGNLSVFKMNCLQKGLNAVTFSPFVITGKMQLVDQKIHNKFKHNGGNSLW